jgi:hypothetical protein
MRKLIGIGLAALVTLVVAGFILGGYLDRRGSRPFQAPAPGAEFEERPLSLTTFVYASSVARRRNAFGSCAPDRFPISIRPTGPTGAGSVQSCTVGPAAIGRFVLLVAQPQRCVRSF